MHFDYTLKTTEERIAYVENLLATMPQEKITNKTLSFMSDYILFIVDRDQTKKEKKEENPIVTRNREMTVSKRQTSYEGIIASLENGEDGLYNLIRQDGSQRLDNKTKITDNDIAKVPGLQEQIDIINKLGEQFKKADTGAKRYSLKKQIIESWRQAYILKTSYYGTPAHGRISNQVKTMAHLPIHENIWLDENDNPQSDSMLTLINPVHVSFLLCHYSQLKQECEDKLDSDMHYLLMDLEDLATTAIEEKYPEFFDLLVWKIDGLTNDEIQELMREKYDAEHSGAYYSTIWRKKIPQLIADEAKKQFLVWYFTNIEYGSWKKCSQCGEIKLAHSMFYAKNTTKSGWYSMCKECKNKKNKERLKGTK